MSSVSTTARCPAGRWWCGSATAPSWAPRCTNTATASSTPRCRRRRHAPAGGLGVAGSRGLPRGAAARRSRGGGRRRSRPGSDRRHRHRLHRLHGTADPRRRHAAVRAAGAARPPARLGQAVEAPRRPAARRPDQRAGPRPRRAVDRPVRREDLRRVAVRQGSAAPGGGPGRLRPRRAVDRGRRLDRLAALRRRDPQRLHRRLQGHPPGRPIPVDRTSWPRCNPDFADFVAKLDGPLLPLGDPGRRPDRRGRRLDRAAGGHRGGGRQRRRPRHRRRRARPWRPASWSPSWAPRPATWSTAPQLAEVPGMCGVVDGGISPGRWGYEAGQSGVGRHLRLVRRARGAGRCRLARAADRAGRRAAGRRARPGRAGLVERQPVAAGQPRPQRADRRADPGHPAAGRLPRAAGVHRVRHPHDHRGVRRGRRAGHRAGRRRRAHHQPAADADLRRRDQPSAGRSSARRRGRRSGSAIHAAVAAGAYPDVYRRRRRWAGWTGPSTGRTRPGPRLRRALRRVPAAARPLRPRRQTTSCPGCGRSATPPSRRQRTDPAALEVVG